MKTHILIVDDEILQLNSIGKIIRRYRPDYEVVTTHQPQEALELLQTRKFNALMTDVKMPQMDGIELISKARDLKIEPLEIIILSGFDDFQYAQSAISFEVLEYMLKPIDGTSLQQVLKKLEDKLEQNERQQKMENAYSHMSRRQCATALYKKVCGLVLTSIEEQTIEHFGDRMRMVLVEGSWENETWISAMPPNACVEPLAHGQHLVFVPGQQRGLDEIVFPVKGSIVVVSLPCTMGEAAQRWKELRQFVDTARRMEIPLLSQKDWDFELLEKLAYSIREQNIKALDTLAGMMRMALQNGHMTLTALAEKAAEEMARQLKDGYLKHVYASQRREDTLKVFSEKISCCDTPESLCQTIKSMLDSGTGEAYGFSQNVRIYIDAHYNGDCSLNTISEAFHYSAAHFNRLFSAEFGSTYTRWLGNYRLDKARDLLVSTSMSVREIAQAVGIGDAGYFIRQFSHRFGLSPEKYRRHG